MIYFRNDTRVAPVLLILIVAAVLRHFPSKRKYQIYYHTLKERFKSSSDVSNSSSGSIKTQLWVRDRGTAFLQRSQRY